MLSVNTLRYGHDAPLPEQRVLHAGPVSVIYEAGDLRYLSLGDHELVRRIYVAVRDRNWGTIPAQLANERIIVTDDTFQITYDVINHQDAIDFAWHAEISGARDGTLHFRMDGEARASFLRNRIGFCVLHPPTLVGAACRIAHVDGTTENGVFPRWIAPQLVENGRIHPHYPFAEMRALTYEVTPGAWATLHFDGEIFELEDQRNWTDGSFKIYGTPLRLPYPVEITAGTRVQQTLTLTLSDQHISSAHRSHADADARSVTISVDPTRVVPLPRIGLGVTSHDQQLHATELARLQALRPAHLRVDLHLAEARYQFRLAQATREARALGVPLEIALFVSDAAATELQQLRAVLDDTKPRVRTWLIFHIREPVTGAQWERLARAQLADYAPQAVFAVGTNAYFTDLNRARPSIGTGDAWTYSVNPQVHAVDNLSLAETAETIGATVASARQFSGDTPIIISPVTLKPRFNAVATGPASAPQPGVLPPQVDPRQMSLFGACWTLASVKYIAESGAHSATYYETTGWRGVMETAAGSPLPQRFPSLPGAVFPLYHVLAYVNAFAGGTVLFTHSSAPLAVESLALRTGARTRLLLANLTNTPQQARVQLLSPTARLRLLDERNAVTAMRDPERFSAEIESLIEAVAGSVLIALLPYAVACIDGTL